MPRSGQLHWRITSRTLTRMVQFTDVVLEISTLVPRLPRPSSPSFSSSEFVAFSSCVGMFATTHLTKRFMLVRPRSLQRRAKSADGLWGGGFRIGA